MKVTMSEEGRLRDRWRRACFDKNSGEYQQACVSRDVWKACCDSERKAYVLLGRIGVGKGTKNMCKSMALAMKVTPNEDVWLAVGWAGVSRVAAMGKRERLKKIKEIRKVAQGGRLTKKKAKEITGARPPEPRPDVHKDTKRKLDLLVKEVKRLVSAGYLNEAALSPAARDVVGIKKRRSRKAS